MATPAFQLFRRERILTCLILSQPTSNLSKNSARSTFRVHPGSDHTSPLGLLPLGLNHNYPSSGLLYQPPKWSLCFYHRQPMPKPIVHIRSSNGSIPPGIRVKVIPRPTRPHTIWMPLISQIPTLTILPSPPTFPAALFLLAVPQTSQALPCLRAFLLADPSAWNAFPC